ncbi:MAG: DUF99 family protein [Promethearchaeota archaeon]
MTIDKLPLKVGTRLLGIAESGVTGASSSILCGVVIRSDLVIDGVIWDHVTIRGMDATQTILRMLERLNRLDIRGIMLHGTVIAGYNIVDMTLLFEELSLPIISVTKQPQENLKQHLLSTFPEDWSNRWVVAQRNGDIYPVVITDTTKMFVQCKGCELEDAKNIIKQFSRSTGLPEPIRVARLLARAFVEQTSQP